MISALHLISGMSSLFLFLKSCQQSLGTFDYVRRNPGKLGHIQSITPSGRRPTAARFCQQLPYHDLMFLRRDIIQQSSIDRLLYDIESEKMYTLLAEDETHLLGYATLYRNDFSWSRHVAEIRALISPKARKIGVGRLLTREAFNVGLSLGIQVYGIRQSFVRGSKHSNTANTSYTSCTSAHPRPGPWLEPFKLYPAKRHKICLCTLFLKNCSLR